MNNNELKKWRLEQGLSQSKLAKQLGVSQALISHYERVGLPQSLPILRRLSSITGIPVERLCPVE